MLKNCKYTVGTWNAQKGSTLMVIIIRDVVHNRASMSELQNAPNNYMAQNGAGMFYITSSSNRAGHIIYTDIYIYIDNYRNCRGLDHSCSLQSCCRCVQPNVRTNGFSTK